MWSEFLHHITLHFPIVLTLVIAGVGLWSLRDDIPQFQRFVRVVGWACFAATTVTVVSGILAAPGWFGGDGGAELAHHRNLGLTAWIVMGLASASYEWGIRDANDDWRSFAIGVWCVTAFAVFGTGHWGGTELHQDKLPWVDSEAPAPIEAPTKAD
jgi:hypothetical protein